VTFVRTRRAALAALASIAVLALAAPAHATLIGETVGGQSVTLDTATNLQWLDASNTLGLSSNAALADFAGYQLATLSEVEQLFEDAGVPAADVPNGADTNPAPGDLLVSTLGYSYLSTFGLPYTQFWDYLVNGLLGGGTGLYSDDLLTAEVRNSGLGSPGVYLALYSSNFAPDQSSSLYFDFLVKPASVPEPASLPILATALLGFAFIRRPRRS
jgi:PEP-CTERM motif